jgi:hypothetical protein
MDRRHRRGNQHNGQPGYVPGRDAVASANGWIRRGQNFSASSTSITGMSSTIL